MAREFESDEDILVWADSLDERWPERVEVRSHIVEAARSLRCLQPRLLELCLGDGRLSGEVLLAVPGCDGYRRGCIEDARKLRESAIWYRGYRG